MCECGCGNYAAHHKIKAADRSMYAVELHGGCRDCETPIGVIITKHVGASIAQWEVFDLPDLPVNPDRGEWAAEIIDPKDVLKELITLLGEHPLGGEEPDYDCLTDALSDHLGDAMRNAFYTAQKRNSARWDDLEQEKKG